MLVYHKRTKIKNHPINTSQSNDDAKYKSCVGEKSINN